VLRHADAVAVGDRGDRDAFPDRGLKIDVIRPDPRGDRQLELLRLRDPFCRQVSRPERLRDDDLGIGQFAFKDRVLALFVRGHDESMAELFKELRRPSSPDTQPRSAPGVKSIPFGVGAD